MYVVNDNNIDYKDIYNNTTAIYTRDGWKYSK